MKSRTVPSTGESLQASLVRAILDASVEQVMILEGVVSIEIQLESLKTEAFSTGGSFPTRKLEIIANSLCSNNFHTKEIM